MQINKYKNGLSSGWFSESQRHSNARKFGIAGGLYANDMKKKIDWSKALKNLKDDLPHGAGINYDWNVYEKGDYIIAENKFDTMDDAGFYDVPVPFTLKIPKNSPKDFKLTFKTGYHHYVDKYMLRDYLEEQFAEYFSGESNEFYDNILKDDEEGLYAKKDWKERPFQEGWHSPLESEWNNPKTGEMITLYFKPKEMFFNPKHKIGKYDVFVYDKDRKNRNIIFKDGTRIEAIKFAKNYMKKN